MDQNNAVRYQLLVYCETELDENEEQQNIHYPSDTLLKLY